MIAELLQVLRKLAIPVRNVRSVDEMIGADVFDRMRELRFTRLDAEVDLRFSHQLAGFFFEQRHFILGALFPVLVEAIQVIGQPGGANLQKRHAKFGKADRHALAYHAGELEQDARR